MKIKIDQIRTYDDAGYRRRAACLCFKSDCESEVLLVSSSRSHDFWIVPGGGLEPGEEPATTAVREVFEEAGVVGRLGRLLDVFENKDRNKTRTYVFAFVVERLQEEYDDAKGIGRLRRWFSIEEANNILRQQKPVHQLYIDKLINDKDHQRRASLCSRLNHNRGFMDDTVSGDQLTCPTINETNTRCLTCRNTWEVDTRTLPDTTYPYSISLPEETLHCSTDTSRRTMIGERTEDEPRRDTQHPIGGVKG